MELLSVVVPCFREAANLADLHQQVARHLDAAGVRWELILIDDGSPDDTAAVAAALAGADPRVRAMAFSRNFGKEAALLAGLTAARGDAVVLMDADLQHPPALLPDLLARLTPGIDQVVARRNRAGDAWLRTVASRMYYRMANRLTDVPLTDGAGDFRLLSRRAVDAVLALQEVTRFSKGLFSWIGFATVTVDYDNAPRAAGTSSWSLRRLANYGLDGTLSFTTKPLRIATWLGICVLALTVLYTLWLLWGVYVRGIEVPGYVTLVALVTGLSGVQMMLLGVIGEYLARVFVEVKGRPHYLIRSDTWAPATGPAPVTADERPAPRHTDDR